MREPVQRRSRDKVERIIVAATAILSRDSAPLTVRNLAATANVSPGTIYQFFVDMDAVAIAVQNVTLERLSAMLAADVPCELAAEPEDFFIRLLKGVEGLQHRYPETGCLVRASSGNPFITDLAVCLRARIHEHVLQAFGQQQDSAGGLPLVARVDLAGAVLTAVLQRLPPIGTPDRASYLTAAARVASAALRG